MNTIQEAKSSTVNLTKSARPPMTTKTCAFPADHLHSDLGSCSPVIRVLRSDRGNLWRD